MTVNTIILSAGKSSRMGSDKALLKLGEQTFVEKLTQTFAQISSKVFLVVSEKLYDKLKIKQLYLPKTQIIINPNPELGRMSSILIGLKHSGNYPTFLHNIDTPQIKLETLTALLHRYNKQKIIIPTHKNKKGHPILIGEKIIPDLLKQPPNSNLKNFVKNSNFQTVEVPDSAILENINTVDDYMQLTNTLSN